MPPKQALKPGAQRPAHAAKPAAAKTSGAPAKRSASVAKPSAKPSAEARVVHCEAQVGAVMIRVVEADITLSRVDAVINAANSGSFKPMDGGLSGALRNACLPDDVTGVVKRWWDDEGAEHSDVNVPCTQAGVQAAAGGLRTRGVQFVVHAVGPFWGDYPAKQSTFNIVLPLIRTTVRRALAAAARVGARSCALPAISGGLFTHWRPGSDIREREQRAARLAVVEAAFAWAREHSGSPLVSVELCDLSRSQKGCVDFFVEAFETVTQQQQQQQQQQQPLQQQQPNPSPKAIGGNG